MNKLSAAMKQRYFDVINWCTEARVSPLFSGEDWRGIVYHENGKTLSVRYPVKCNVCGNEYLTTFRSSFPHLAKCKHTSVSKIPSFPVKQGKSLVENSMGITAQQYNVTIISKFDNEYRVKCNYCGTEYLSPITNSIKLCPKCSQKCKQPARERFVAELLTNYNISFIPNYKFQYQDGSTHELDIFVPSHNVAFELNGYYFHNSGNFPHSKPKDYHARKTTECAKLGIKLYHIWESTSYELLESIVLSKLGLAHRVFARKLTLATLDSKASSNFFNLYHIDGNVRSKITFALVNEKFAPVCALSLNQRRIQSSNIVQWEIARFATRYNINVVGGYSRLLHHALEYLKKQNCHSLVSYCNRDLSPIEENTVYHKLGFKFEMESGPIYKYWASRDFDYFDRHFTRGTVLSRQTFQKQKLIEHFKSSNLPLSDSCSEKSMTEYLGLMPCYNSGNFKYSLSF